MGRAHLIFTSQQPTLSGVYWFRKSDQETWGLVTVMKSKTDQEWLVVYGDGRTADFLDNWKGDWAGPLPTPVGYQSLEHIDVHAIEQD